MRIAHTATRGHPTDFALRAASLCRIGGMMPTRLRCLAGIRICSLLALIGPLLYLSHGAGAASYADLYNFAGVPHDDGMNPGGSLIQVGGLLYGVAKGGNGVGVIFSYNPASNVEGTLYSFGNAPDGAGPVGSLLASGSTLYGMTSAGGALDFGTVFSFSTGSNANDGTDPRGSLILVGDTLYGTADNGGGSLNDGTIFGFDLDTDSYSILHAFDGSDGANPTGDLMAVGNTLCGLASNGGTHGAGVIFSVTVPEPALLLLARRRQRIHFTAEIAENAEKGKFNLIHE